jgi:hypothetical protein
VVEARFRAVVEMAPDTLVITDQEGRITLVNHQTEALIPGPMLWVLIITFWCHCAMGMLVIIWAIPWA